MSDQTDIETPHELVLVNTYPATPAEVWAAWTEPEPFAAWWVGEGWTTHDVTLEVREGGRFLATQSANDGSFDMPFAGFYREVVQNEKLVFTLTDAETAGEPARTVLTVILREIDGGTAGSSTEQEFHQTGVVTDEHFELLKAGTMSFFDQLGAHLASAPVRA